MGRPRSAERGLVMIALLATAMIVTVISVALIGLMHTDMTHASIQYALARSFYLAQSGLAEAKARAAAAADPADYTTTDAGVVMSYGGGQFTFWVDAGPATGCGPGLKTLEAVGQVPYLARTFSTRVRACGVPGTPFLAALFGVSPVQFKAGSRIYLAPYLTGTPGGGGSVGSFTEINFSDNDVRVNALSEVSSESVGLRDGTFLDYALYGFSERPSYTSTPTTDPAPWILSAFGDLVKAQPTTGLIPNRCGTPRACVTVGNGMTDVQRVADLREANYVRHVYVKDLREASWPELALDPGVFRGAAASNTANEVLNTAVGLRDKRDSVYTRIQFYQIVTYLRKHPSQFLQGTVYIDGSVQFPQSVNLGGTAGNVTLVVRGDLSIGRNLSVTNRHDLATASGRRTPGILVFKSTAPSALLTRLCGGSQPVNGSGQLVLCEGSTLVADGLVYTQDGMVVERGAFVDQVGAMYHGTLGTSQTSFSNRGATVVLRFDPLALTVFGSGLSTLSWQQLR